MPSPPPIAQIHRALVYDIRDEGGRLMLYIDAYQIKVREARPSNSRQPRGGCVLSSADSDSIQHAFRS